MYYLGELKVESRLRFTAACNIRIFAGLFV